MNKGLIRRSFHDLAIPTVFRLYETLVHPQLDYDIQACSLNFVANINYLEGIHTCLVTGLHHRTYKVRLDLVEASLTMARI